jgi:hypothetical protein
MGWIKKAMSNELAEVNQIEVDMAISDGGYQLTTYSEAKEKGLDKPESKIEYLTFNDYRKMKPRKDWIIESLGVYPRETSMKTGNTGSFKSIETLYRALCIASGKPYLNKFKVRKKPVLIISAENPEHVDAVRMKAIARGMKLKRVDNLYIVPRRVGADILSASFRKKLSDLIIQKKIKVLFIDTINPVTPGLDDNSAKEVMRVFNEFLKPFADTLSLHIEYLHHTDKRGRDYLGSMKWKGNVDNEWFVERDKLHDEFRLQNTKNRGGEIESLRVKVNFLKTNDELDKITFELLEQKGVGRKEKAHYTKKDYAKFGIKDTLKKGSFSYNDLKVLVMKEKHVSEGTFKTAVKEMEIEGSIIKNETGYKLLK